MKLVQGACCRCPSYHCTAQALSDRLGVCLLQVLDDSTCKVTRQLVDEKAAEWAERGIKCEVVRRTNRQGYKAGALKDVRPSLLPFPMQPFLLPPSWHPATHLLRTCHSLPAMTCKRSCSMHGN